MLKFIKNWFKKEEDPNRAAMIKHFKNSFRGFDDTEQAVLMLRLSGATQEQTCIALDLTLSKLEIVEQQIIGRLKK